MQTINDPNAGVAGSEFGESIAQALQGLAQRKIQRLNEQHQHMQRAQAFRSLYPQIQPQQASALTQMNPQEMPYILQALSAQQNQGQGSMPNLLQNVAAGMEYSPRGLMRSERRNLDRSSTLKAKQLSYGTQRFKHFEPNERELAHVFNAMFLPEMDAERAANRASATVKAYREKKMTPDIIKYFMELAENDPAKATELATSEGFKVE